MEQATYFKCADCDYEFLARAEKPACPHCKGDKLEHKDMKTILGLDE